jgi:glycosyltransferase involved in cell wall biosynthesis
VASEPSVSVVIPALNEAENLPLVLPLIPSWVYEVILVDGASTDGTVEVAHQVRPDIRFVQQHGRGKGSALRTGFSAARGDIVVMLDADGSTDPREIPAFVQALTDGADFVKGSRFLPGGGTSDMPLYRKLGNWSFVIMVRLLFGGRYTDLCYGYNAFWRRVLPSLRLNGQGFEIETMMNVRALKAGLRVVEVPSFEHRRVYGVSRLRTIPDGLRVLRTIFRERFSSLPRAPQPFGVPPEGARAAVIVPIGTTAARVTVPVEAGIEAEMRAYGPGQSPDGLHGDGGGGGRAEPAVAR